MAEINRIDGTSAPKFQIGLRGPFVKNNAGILESRNQTDTAYAAVAASLFKTYGNDFELNSGAAQAGADWRLTLRRPSTGMTENVTVIMPSGTPTSNQALTVASYAAGVITLQYSTIAGGNDKLVVDSTSIAFGSSSPITLFALPANAVVLSVEVIVDSAFTGTPALSVGVAGTLSKYVSATDLDLTYAAPTTFLVRPALAPNAASENLIATYAANGATAGTGRVLVSYVIPS